MTADPYRPEMQPPPTGYGPQPYQQQPYQPPAPGYQMYPYYWPQAAYPPQPMVDGFLLTHPRLKPIPSGPAIGSLVAGIGGILGALPGLFSAAFSPWTGLTFFVMAALLGGGSVLLGSYARRQIRAAAGGISGKGLATSGLVLGIVASSLAGITGLITIASI